MSAPKEVEPQRRARQRSSVDLNNAPPIPVTFAINPAPLN
jgi:hypothetical protein